MINDEKKNIIYNYLKYSNININNYKDYFIHFNIIFFIYQNTFYYIIFLFQSEK